MSPLETMRERRSVKKGELDKLLDGPTTEQRDLTNDESTSFDLMVEEIRKSDERIGELEATDDREARAAAARVLTGSDAGTGSPAKVTDPIVYAKGNHQRSYFRDLAYAQLNQDRDAFDRLRRHAAAQADMESRALGDTNATGGSGGEFAPPEWLVADYIKLARPGRITADLFRRAEVPMGVSSINLPKIGTGTTVALQSTQNTALSQTDLTTLSVSTGFSTVGGKQVVSQQMLDQSAINFDEVITADLAAAYAMNIGTQIWLGAGTGSGTNSVINGLLAATVPAGNQIVFTAATPTAAGFYSKALGALTAFETFRFAQPTVWVMHPRRWNWLLAQADSTGRPLVVPEPSGPWNSMGTVDNMAAGSGPNAGTFLGLPVAIDPLVPTNLGTGTNQDPVYLLKADDLWLFESPPQAEVFREPYADSMGVLFRLYSYLGTILNRQANSIATITGTGLVAPIF